ncbi:MAG: hypothetical protein F6K21_11175 [Symploca sp. SIO2D2]|nr:hypothetical protein [Symploca sp. SIO2D2]
MISLFLIAVKWLGWIAVRYTSLTHPARAAIVLFFCFLIAWLGLVIVRQTIVNAPDNVEGFEVKLGIAIAKWFENLIVFNCS